VFTLYIKLWLPIRLFFEQNRRWTKSNKIRRLSVNQYTAAGNLITAKLFMSYSCVLSVLISQLH
jgi:hypothetical protein